MQSRIHSFIWLSALGLVALSGCNKDSNPPPPAPPPAPAPPAATYTVGGTVAGLSGSVTLANNGGDARTVSANGAFTFATSLATGAGYAVTVTAQPATQTCTVASGAGNVASANVGNVAVNCVTNTVTVGGTVTGLTGAGLVLQNNGGDNLARGADGAFTFATPINSGAAYNVTVLTQPSNPAQVCTPANNTGNASANVSNVTISCATPPPFGSADIGPAGGTVNGAYGAQIVIPPGALATTVRIGLARDSSNSPDVVVPNFDTVGAIYELTPHGQAFALPVTVRIPFDAEQVANDADPVLYKAEPGGPYSAQTTTVNGGFVETQVTSFSWMAAFAASTKPRMVYALQSSAGALSLVSHRIDKNTGALSAPTSTQPVGDFPTSLVAHPSGKYLYVTNAGMTAMNGIDPNSVALYRLSTTNGKILQPSTSSVITRQPAGYRPTMPVIDPNGRFLYVINFGSVSFDGGSDIDMFRISATTGALTLTGSAISGNGAQPMGIVFNRPGTRAYVLYAGNLSTNPLSSVVARYDVNPTTGAFTGPVDSAAVCGLGNAPWSIAIDPNGRALHVACNTGNQIASFSINPGSGALSALGTITVQDKPASLAADSLGRFVFAAKQQPFFTVNLLAYRADATTGALTLANQILSGCTGSCVGPTATVAEPQGNFVYSVDVTGSLASNTVNQTTGALTNTGARANAWLPQPGGIGFPFTFAATGVSPVWQSNCTQGCALSGGTAGSSGNPPTNPSPPTSHLLSVSIGPYFGYVTSSPAGIDYAPSTNADPLGRNDTSSEFPAGTNVQLCSSPPPAPFGAYDITWMGSCSGTGQCTSVTMDSDKSCMANFQLRIP